jgi:hypothetical protein
MFFFLIALCLLSAGAKRLIRTSDTQVQWMTEKEILGLIQNKIRFMDVTTFGFDSFKPSTQGIV